MLPAVRHARRGSESLPSVACDAAMLVLEEDRFAMSFAAHVCASMQKASEASALNAPAFSTQAARLRPLVSVQQPPKHQQRRSAAQQHALGRIQMPRRISAACTQTEGHRDRQCVLQQLYIDDSYHHGCKLLLDETSQHAGTPDSLPMMPHRLWLQGKVRLCRMLTAVPHFAACCVATSDDVELRRVLAQYQILVQLRRQWVDFDSTSKFVWLDQVNRHPY